jgi:hypothetical protein
VNYRQLKQGVPCSVIPVGLEIVVIIGGFTLAFLSVVALFVL